MFWQKTCQNQKWPIGKSLNERLDSWILDPNSTKILHLPTSIPAKITQVKDKKKDWGHIEV